MEKVIAILVSAISNYIWKAVVIEARVYRGKADIKDRIDEFKKHVEDIEKSELQGDDIKNERLDNAARTLLYGVRKPLP